MDRIEKARKYRTLFLSTLQLSAFTFGGGFVIIPLMRKKFVEQLHWIDEQEMLDLTAIAQSSPGAIAVNASILVGYRVAGVPGALVSTLGCILPACFIVTLLAFIYDRFKGLTLVQGILSGLRPAVVAMIASAGLSLLILSLYGQRALPADLGGINYISAGIFAAALFVLRRWKLSPVWVMLGAGAAGVLLYSLF